MNMHSLIADQTAAAINWEASDKAIALLRDLDAAERQSDRYTGLGWTVVAQAFAEHARECECQLDNLRSEAMDTAARLESGSPKGTDEWWDAFDAADDQAVTVAQAADRARRLRFGDALDEAA